MIFLRLTLHDILQEMGPGMLEQGPAEGLARAMWTGCSVSRTAQGAELAPESHHSGFWQCPLSSLGPAMQCKWKGDMREI